MERGIAELMFKANGDIRKICDQKLHQLYGKIVPDEIIERLNAEPAGIIDNGYESYYFIAQNIARISLGKGYMTGTRGTLAGSFVAYLMGITDINPLPEKYGGYNIPPEVHYGIDYSKKPEIVFNVAPEIRDDIVADLKQLDGVGDIVRFKVHKDFHPTAFLIIPEGVDLEENLSVDEYEKCFYRFDLCEYKGLQMLKHLQEETGVNPLDITLNDKKLFDDLQIESGVSGLAGARTTHILEEILPYVEVKGISDLIKVLGLAFGTGVWEGNAKDLIGNDTTNLTGCISSRDDVLLYLEEKGIDKELAYEMMEYIRKGKAKRLGLLAEWKEAMREHDIPGWYIDSCEKIEYLFPKAHAVTYALMGLRILYYKINYPEV